MLPIVKKYLMCQDSQDDLRVSTLVQLREAGSYLQSQGSYSKAPFHHVTLTEGNKSTTC